MAVVSVASAVWKGTLKEGDGGFSAGSGAFSGAFTAATRFEGKPGTNPEELLAAALASCYSMALSAALERAGTPSTSIETTAHATMDTVDGKPTVAHMKLVVKATVPGATDAAFQEAAQLTKTGCPVSRALTGIPVVEIEAALVG